jgi:hypothetical protein
VTEWPNVPVLKTLRTAYPCLVLLCKSMQILTIASAHHMRARPQSVPEV